MKSGYVKGEPAFVVKIAGGGFAGHGSSGLMASFSQTTGELRGVSPAEPPSDLHRTTRRVEALSRGVSLQGTACKLLLLLLLLPLTHCIA